MMRDTGNNKKDWVEDLAYTGFRQMLPSIHLRPYVQCYWQIQSKFSLNPSTELMHPDGGMGIILNFGDHLIYEGQEIHAYGFMDGIHTRTRQMTMAGHIDAIGIRFNPGGASRFFSIPLAEINNSNLSLNDLAKNQFIERCQQEKAVNPEGNILKFIDKLLLEMRIEPQRPDLLIQTLTNRIKTSKGKVSIAETIYDIGKSYRQIERLFKSYIGMTPKHYARIMRVENARYQLKNKTCQSCTEIGELAGFYDQAHFIREFKSIIGLPPTAYINFKR